MKSETRREARWGRVPFNSGKTTIPSRSTIEARTSRWASSRNSCTIGCQESNASTTPRSCVASSTTGRARTATTPISGIQKGLPWYGTPSRADSNPLRNS